MQAAGADFKILENNMKRMLCQAYSFSSESAFFGGHLASLSLIPRGDLGCIPAGYGILCANFCV